VDAERVLSQKINCNSCVELDDTLVRVSFNETAHSATLWSAYRNWH
jgi:hypothetical protein